MGRSSNGRRGAPFIGCVTAERQYAGSVARDLQQHYRTSNRHKQEQNIPETHGKAPRALRQLSPQQSCSRRCDCHQQGQAQRPHWAERKRRAPKTSTRAGQFPPTMAKIRNKKRRQSNGRTRAPVVKGVTKLSLHEHMRVQGCMTRSGPSISLRPCLLINAARSRATTACIELSTDDNGGG